MLTTPFLTQLDSRAAIKGSRDPLGVQSIWSRLGHRVVANLTTVSNSVRDFTVLLLGYYFVERVADEGGTEGDLATFLKWEQLAAYARAHVIHERGFRGTERVARRLSEGTRVRIGIDAGAQILGNQKIYGLWGLYTIPAKASDLLEGDPTRLTLAARDVVERSLLPTIESVGARTVRGIIERLRMPEYTLDVRERSRDIALLEGIAKALRTLRAPERDLYRDHLLHGGPGDHNQARGTQGMQRVLAELLAETLDDHGWSLAPWSMRVLARQALGKGDVGSRLAFRLERIVAAETLIAPAVAFYEYVLSCDGQAPSQVAGDVRRHWGTELQRSVDFSAIEELEPELRARTDDPDSGRRWVRLAAAFYEARYEEAINLVLEQNAAIMKARTAAAPWVEIRDDKLNVRFRDEHLPRLPAAADLASYWRHAYFIESLRSVAAALRGPR
jgi:hypothetical protein